MYTSTAGLSLSMCTCTVVSIYLTTAVIGTCVSSNGGPIPLFSDTFDTKYRAKNFTNSDTNPYSYMVAGISHQCL